MNSYLRRRSYFVELTMSGSVPQIVRPFHGVKRVFPRTLSGIVDSLRTVSRSLKPPRKRRRRDVVSQLRGLM